MCTSFYPPMSAFIIFSQLIYKKRHFHSSLGIGIFHGLMLPFHTSLFYFLYSTLEREREGEKGGCLTRSSTVMEPIECKWMKHSGQYICDEKYWHSESWRSTQGIWFNKVKVAKLKKSYFFAFINSLFFFFFSILLSRFYWNLCF